MPEEKEIPGITEDPMPEEQAVKEKKAGKKDEPKTLVVEQVVLPPTKEELDLAGAITITLAGAAIGWASVVNVQTAPVVMPAEFWLSMRQE